jgi:hypothetical protein
VRLSREGWIGGWTWGGIVGRRATFRLVGVPRREDRGDSAHTGKEKRGGSGEGNEMRSEV